jgi:acyl carrier protein
MNVREKMVSLVVKEFKVDESIVTDDILIFDMGVDSLGLIEFLFVLEEEFKINIENDEASKLITFSDLVSLVEKLTSK